MEELFKPTRFFTKPLPGLKTAGRVLESQNPFGGFLYPESGLNG